jgi:AcrR family transcriptional regulator
MRYSTPESKNSDLPGGKLTARNMAKQRTRQNIMAAARRLFAELGYEGATIRDIATAAGMSTGAVFANFTDKSDLFSQIMAEDGAAVVDVMQAAADQAADIETALTEAFMAGYGFYRRQVQLAHAALSVAWTKAGAKLHRLDRRGALRSLFETQLLAGEARGELRADGGLGLRGDMLCDLYLSNYQHVVSEAADFEALEARVRGQVRILLQGARSEAA